MGRARGNTHATDMTGGFDAAVGTRRGANDAELDITPELEAAARAQVSGCIALSDGGGYGLHDIGVLREPENGHPKGTVYAAVSVISRDSPTLPNHETAREALEGSFDANWDEWRFHDRLGWNLRLYSRTLSALN